jgi:fructose-specific phosphotransferase system IIC component
VAASHDKIGGFLPNAVFGGYYFDIIHGFFAAYFLRTQHVIPDQDFRQP